MKGSIEEWIDFLKNNPEKVKIQAGVDFDTLQQIKKRYNLPYIPTSYAKLLRFSNGLVLFGGEVFFFGIDKGDGTISDWNSLYELNQPQFKSTMPESEKVLLIGGNMMGDYFGINYKDKEPEIVYISPELNKAWGYKSLEDFMESMWEEWSE